MKSWRDHCRPIIARVIAEVGTTDEKKLRDALRAAYPYGVRQYYPYKTWCHEIRVQLGKTKMRSREQEKSRQPCPGQQELFGKGSE